MIHFKLWAQNILNSLTVHLIQPSHNFDIHYQPTLPYTILKIQHKNRQNRLLPNTPSLEKNTYDPTIIPEETIANIIENQSLWHEQWF